ncbi:hypothetical protein F4781DRAFT_158073 [Annulohypoxylon bovei var. microspora]|nr:hypothetical protein F4781DRAFT_158073 [Annulohypoxylon bovei var. microspora]
MKYTIVVLALATFASAQSLSDIPQCALPCIDSARTGSTNCSADDYACICKNKDAITTAGTSCVLKSCGATVATGQVLPAVSAFCNAVESGNSGSSSSLALSSSAIAASTSTDVISTSASATEIATTSETSVSTSAASMTSMASTSVGGSNSTGNYTSSYPTAVPTAGAASVAGSLAVMALGFLAAL